MITTPSSVIKLAPIIKKFKPKYSPLELSKSPLRHASVFITKATTPKLIYVQIEDDDKLLYRKMLIELEEEFRSSSTQSSTYCPSPVMGNSYCIQYGAQWHRVLIDNKNKIGKCVFFVDIGCRRKILPEMIFHRLPDRFMELRAQAVRCCLVGVYPPKRPNGSTMCHFPDKAHQFVHQFDAKEAVAFFHSWNAGQVGYFDKPATRELEAFVTLYPNDDSDSLNMQLCRSPIMARPVGFSQYDQTEHREIRRRLTAARCTSMVSIEPGFHQATSSYSLLSVSSESVDLTAKTCPKTDWKSSSELESKSKTTTASYSSFTLLSEVAIRPSAGDNKTKESTHLKHTFEDDSLTVSFVGCQSPDELFFRTTEMMEEFIKIQNVLYSTFIGAHEAAHEESINFDVGFICAVNYDGRWYRAQVVEINQYPDVTVFLLDKGFAYKVAASEIQRIPDRLEEIPCTLIHCSLYGVYPPSGSVWEDTAAQFIVHRLKKVETIHIVLQQRQNQDPKISSVIFPVTVYFYDKEIDPVKGPDSTCISLNEKLVSHGLAVTSTNNVISSHSHKRIWKSSELPKVGHTFEARASWINTKSEIFVQDVRWKPELKRIQHYLKEKYDGTLSTEADLRCAPGDICIVRDGFNWYRGIIKAIMGNEVTVHYVDYGITGVIDINDVRLDISLEDTPMKVLRCSLYTLNSLVHAYQNWNPIDKLQAMRKSIVGREFKVVVMAPGPPLQVTMFPKS